MLSVGSRRQGERTGEQVARSLLKADTANTARQCRGGAGRPLTGRRARPEWRHGLSKRQLEEHRRYAVGADGRAAAGLLHDLEWPVEMRIQKGLAALPVRLLGVYLRSVIDQVEVDDAEIRIHGRRDVLERLVMGGGATPAGVPSL